MTTEQKYYDLIKKCNDLRSDKEVPKGLRDAILDIQLGIVIIWRSLLAQDKIPMGKAEKLTGNKQTTINAIGKEDKCQINSSGSI